MFKPLSVFTWWVLLGGWLVNSPMAVAAIECTGNSQEFKPTYACINTDPTSNSSVTFRRMPAWGGNSGLVLIDLCTVSDFTNVGQIQEKDGFTYAIGVDQNEPFIDGEGTAIANEELKEGVEQINCIRRYCTEDMSQFSLAVDIFTIPIGYVFELGITVGFSETDFRIDCQEASIREVL